MKNVFSVFGVIQDVFELVTTFGRARIGAQISIN